MSFWKSQESSGDRACGARWVPGALCAMQRFPAQQGVFFLSNTGSVQGDGILNFSNLWSFSFLCSRPTHYSTRKTVPAAQQTLASHRAPQVPNAPRCSGPQGIPETSKNS